MCMILIDFLIYHKKKIMIRLNNCTVYDNKIVLYVYDTNRFFNISQKKIIMIRLDNCTVYDNKIVLYVYDTNRFFDI